MQRHSAEQSWTAQPCTAPSQRIWQATCSQTRDVNSTLTQMRCPVMYERGHCATPPG